MTKLRIGKEDAIFADGYKIIKSGKQVLVTIAADVFEPNGLAFSKGDDVRQAMLREDIWIEGVPYQGVLIARRRPAEAEG